MPVHALPEAARPIRFRALGTEIAIHFGGWIEPGVSAAVQSVFLEVERTASRFDPASELNRLAHGTCRDPSSLLREVVTAADAVEQRTDGLVTARLRRRIEVAGYDRSAPWRGARTIPCRAPATPNAWTEWDFGGIGKGFAVDRALAVTQGRCAGILIDAGGDIAVAGIAPGGGPWRVDLPHGAGVAVLRGGGIATSSSLQRRWRCRGGVAHHLIDPATGDPAHSDVVSATAWARSALWAEVAAKALVLRGSPWAERVHAWLPEVVLSWRGADGRTTVERAFHEEVLAWVAPAA